MKRLVKIFLILFILVSIPTIGMSQCKGFTKKTCVPKIKPYIYNGQLNSALLNEGDVAELLLTFYGSQEYRLVVCCQDILGQVEFKLLDTERNVIFNNADHNYIDSWDFVSSSTQQLIVEVTIPESNSGGSTVVSGCVSILVGFLSTE
ncbi:MAG: hypothetical protein KAT68_06040 [Bacteroidales bacterium]|nr:hypothetical protein [Bacteroidales bacterium]